MTKKIIFSLLVSLIFIFSAVAYAAENPFQGLTQEQVIQKYFEGRQLDPIEGVWLDRDAKPIIIIKTGLVDTKKKYGDYDYLMLEYSSSSNVEIVGIYKTQYPSCFDKRGRGKSLLRLLSPTTLHYAWLSGFVAEDYFFTRIYPIELK